MTELSILMISAHMKLYVGIHVNLKPSEDIWGYPPVKSKILLVNVIYRF